jgi:hypothetical protein
LTEVRKEILGDLKNWSRKFLSLSQWFSTAVDFYPPGDNAMSGDIFGYQNLGHGLWEEAQDAAKLRGMRGAAPNTG